MTEMAPPDGSSPRALQQVTPLGEPGGGGDLHGSPAAGSRPRRAGSGAGRVWAVRAATLALWLLVMASAASGIAALLLRQPPARPGAGRVPAASVGPEGFAELYVATFLGDAGEGKEDLIKGFYPVPVSLRGVVPGARYVSRTATLRASQVEPGYWSVVVAADLLVATQGGYRRDGIHYYSVGVAEVEGGFAATSLPAEIPPPVTASAPQPELPLTAPTQGPAADAASRFFSALLAGEGELQRYVAPNSRIRPVVPAPFASASVRRLGLEPAVAAGATHLAQAEVEAVDAEERRQLFHYFLRMAERDGRWEVVELLPVAPIRPGRG